jgi:hypothetical protein
MITPELKQRLETDLTFHAVTKWMSMAIATRVADAKVNPQLGRSAYEVIESAVLEAILSEGIAETIAALIWPLVESREADEADGDILTNCVWAIAEKLGIQRPIELFPQ